MRVLMQTRPNIDERGGGDYIQMVKTKEFLENLGIQVNISTNTAIDLTNYDIVHIFNTPFFEHSYFCLKNAKKQKKPVVFSTIYWNQEELAIECYKGKFQLIRKIFGKKTGKKIIKIRNKISKNGRILKKILHEADILLPNSDAEKELLIKDFNLPLDKRFTVVPNAVDSNIFLKAAPDYFFNKYKIKNFILCVGRIECRKNQDKLIEAMLNTNIPIVFIGADNFDKEYSYLCRKKAKERGNVIFINDLPHNELPSAYAAAKIHALPSWYDTPGLSNLEAILADCNIVTTNRGPMKEYFLNLAWLCDPTSPDSIKKAVLSAYKKPFSQKLKKYVLENFTWQKTAEKTLESYNSLTSG